MVDRLSMNLFCNDGVSVVETDRGPVEVSGEAFLAGWQGKRPPFGQKDLRVREELDPGTYEAAAWRNDEVRARWSDGSGKRHSVVIERDGKPFHLDGDPTPPAEVETARMIYLNLRLKPQDPWTGAGSARAQAAPESKSRFDD